MFRKNLRIRMPSQEWHKGKKVVEITDTHFTISKNLWEDMGVVDDSRLGVAVESGVMALYIATDPDHDPYMKVSMVKTGKDYKGARSCQAKTAVTKLKKHFGITTGEYQLSEVTGEFYVIKTKAQLEQENKGKETVTEEIFPSNPQGVYNPPVKH